MKVEEELHVEYPVLERSRTKRRRKVRRRNRAFMIVVITALLAAGTWSVTTVLGGTGEGRRGAVLGKKDPQTTILFMIRRIDDLSRRSDMLAVFGIDGAGRSPIALLIPSSAQTEIPGHGLDFAGRGFSFGGMPLQALVVDNVLGIALDNTVAMTDDVMVKMVDQIGGLDIDVHGPLLRADGFERLVPEFEPGRQRMDGETIRRYLRFQGPDETELSRLARAQQVWEALVTEWGRVGMGVLAQRFRSLGKEHNVGLETGLSPLELAEFFSAFAAAGADNRIYSTLPVTPVSAGGDEPVLRIDEDKVAPLVREYFSPSIPANPYRGARIEVQNGNGIPQIGAGVALKIVPQGFRIVRNRNADRFDYEQTRIIVYSRDEKMTGAARKIRDLLGVGEIELGLHSQTVVDVTVIVGHDFTSELNASPAQDKQTS